MNRVALLFSLYFWAQVRGTAVRPADNNTMPSLWEVPSDDDRYSSVYTYHPRSAQYASLGWEKIVEATVYKYSDDRSETDVIDNLQVVPDAFDRLLNAMNVNEKVHIITLVGFEAKGGKAFVLNSIGAATTDILLPDEEFFNFDFQSFASNNRDARNYPTISFGVFATQPFKRFGKWFILQMIRYPEARNGVPDQVLRLRALALQVSSGAIFLSLKPELLAAEDDLKTMVNYYPTNASPLPVVGLAAAPIQEHGPREMLHQQFDTIKRKVDISRVLQPIGDVGSFQINTRDASHFVCKGPAECFREYYDSKEDRHVYMCNNFREAARMGNLIMTSVRDDRSIGVGVLKDLMTQTVAKLNDLTLNVKHMWQQVGYEQCALEASAYFHSDESVAEGRIIVPMNNSDARQAKKQEHKNKGFVHLKEQYRVIWETVKKECLNAFNAEFTVWSEGVELITAYLQTDRANNQTRRAVRAERERDAAQSRADGLQNDLNSERIARQAAEATAPTPVSSNNTVPVTIRTDSLSSTQILIAIANAYNLSSTPLTFITLSTNDDEEDGFATVELLVAVPSNVELDYDVIEATLREAMVDEYGDDIEVDIDVDDVDGDESPEGGAESTNFLAMHWQLAVVLCIVSVCFGFAVFGVIKCVLAKRRQHDIDNRAQLQAADIEIPERQRPLPAAVPSAYGLHSDSESEEKKENGDVNPGAGGEPDVELEESASSQDEGRRASVAAQTAAVTAGMEEDEFEVVDDGDSNQVNTARRHTRCK